MRVAMMDEPISWDISGLAYNEIDPLIFPLYRDCRSARGSADRIGTGSIVESTCRSAKISETADDHLTLWVHLPVDLRIRMTA